VQPVSVTDGDHRLPKAKIDKSFVSMLEMLQDLLRTEDDPVRQQKLIELLIAGHASRFPDKKTAHFVIDAMAKHVKQIMG
jgi:hypothetical protein